MVVLGGSSIESIHRAILTSSTVRWDSWELYNCRSYLEYLTLIEHPHLVAVDLGSEFFGPFEWGCRACSTAVYSRFSQLLKVIFSFWGSASEVHLLSISFWAQKENLGSSSEASSEVLLLRFFIWDSSSDVPLLRFFIRNDSSETTLWIRFTSDSDTVCTHALCGVRGDFSWRQGSGWALFAPRCEFKRRICSVSPRWRAPMKGRLEVLTLRTELPGISLTLFVVLQSLKSVARVGC